MEDSALQFKNGNPGAVQYGNFINYYQFHPPENRIDLLPIDIWNQNDNFHALDVGCNTGILSNALYNFLRKNQANIGGFVGIDIDPVLIQRACEENPNEILFKSLDIMHDEGRIFLEDYLRAQQLQQFDATFCFSITMWIHLNYGDSGLEQFLKLICNLSRLIVIEPQPWKCYKSAVKRMKLSNFEFPHFSALKIRQNVETAIEQYLTDTCKVVKIYESDRSKWDRKVMVFVNKI